jgi:hypothetical protein
MASDLENSLYLNEQGRWCLNGIELISGSFFEIYIQGHWIRVVIEYHGQKHYVFPSSIRLHRGLIARFLGQYTD